MKKILITGTTGLLDLGAFKYLSQKDDLIVENISLWGDDWKKADLSGYDSVIHCVGVIPKKDLDTETFYSVNHILTRDFAIKAKNDGVKHFVYISSMAVYGVNPSVSDGIVYAETPLSPTSDYGKSKYLGEQELNKLESNSFKVASIRVPSIYSKENTAYFSQYEYINSKFKIIPLAFKNCVRSAIHLDNLCELIYLIIKNEYVGKVCPSDNDSFGTVEYCTLISNKKANRFFGKAIELFKNNSIINNLFGSVAFSPDLTNIFDGKYRIVDAEIAIKEIYQNKSKD